MTDDPCSIIADELVVGGCAVRHVELPGRVRRAGAHAAAASGPACRCCSSTPCITSPKPTPIATRSRALEPQPDQPARRASRRSGCGSRARRRAAAATRSSRCSARCRTTTCGSPACGASSRRAAPTCRRSSRSRCRPARCCARSARSRSWTTREVWAYAQRARHSAAAALRPQGYTSIGCEPCTSLPSTRATIGRAAGAVRSSSAAFTFSAVEVDDRAPGLKTRRPQASSAPLSASSTAILAASAGSLLAVTTAVLPFGGGPGDSFSFGAHLLERAHHLLHRARHAGRGAGGPSRSRAPAADRRCGRRTAARRAPRARPPDTG